MKVVNYQHIMPTRYTLDVDLKGVVPVDAAENSTKRLEARKVPTHSSSPVPSPPPSSMHLKQNKSGFYDSCAALRRSHVHKSLARCRVRSRAVLGTLPLALALLVRNV